jgi:AraC-like DNA-binding protein
VVRIGPVTIGRVSYCTDILIATADLAVAYHVMAPLSGGLQSRHRGSSVMASPNRAALYRPAGDIEITWPGTCRLLSVKVARGALERELAAARGHPSASAPALGPSFDLTRGPGRSWLSLVRQLHAEIRDPDSVIRVPQVARRWAQLVVSGLALTVDDPCRDDMAGAVSALRPRSVKRTLDAMHADPGRPFTAPELAAVAGVGTRLLQEAFRRHVGMPPLTYLRELRLEKVHADLCRCDPYRTSVTEVALRWGFTHLGRFAAAYRARYGVPPSRTLRDRR